jgi:formate hydrogenlyase transcriptional activator
LQVPLADLQPDSPRGAAGTSAATGQLRNAEREVILEALRKSRGVIGGPDGAAASLGLKRTTLQSKMRKLGITRPSF